MQNARTRTNIGKEEVQPIQSKRLQSYASKRHKLKKAERQK
jgi:hypothetical protein